MDHEPAPFDADESLHELVSQDLATADLNWPYRVLNGVNAGLLVFDHRGQILYVNRRAGILIGRSPSELIGREVSDVLPILRAPNSELCPSLERLEFDHRRPDGTLRTIGGSISKVGADPGTGVPYRICLFQDITQIRILRDERDRLLQISALNAVLPSMLHELRNPLAAIESMVEVLVEEAGGQLQSDLYAILAEVRRMSLNLQGVGSVSRDLRSDTFAAIDHAVEDVVRVMTAKAQEQGIEIKGTFASMPVMRFDPGVIRGIAFNLIDNAIKASSKGGRVEVSMRLSSSDHVELCVQDNGHGMPKEILARCSELFFSTRPRGSGIGLALCKRVVEKAGGALSIASSEGMGTRVLVSIPMTDNNKQQAT